MRIVTTFLLVNAPLALAHAQAPLQAQGAPRGAAPQAQGAQVEAELRAAQAKSVHEGDDKMTCEQIQAELLTIMQSPGFQAFASQQGAALAGIAGSVGAQPPGAAGATPPSLNTADVTRLAGAAQDAAGAAGQAAGTVQAANAGGAGRGGLGALASAGAFANAAAAAAAAAANARAAAAGQPPGTSTGAFDTAARAAGAAQGTVQLAQTAAATPEVMRGARLLELGQSKGCTLTGAAPAATPQR